MLFFDGLRIGQGELSFRVANVKIEVGSDSTSSPGKILRKQLEEAINGRKIELGSVRGGYTFQLPTCAFLRRERFEIVSHGGLCGDGGELAGQLRIMGNDRNSGKVGTRVKLDSDTLSRRIQDGKLQVAGKLKMGDITLE